MEDIILDWRVRVRWEFQPYEIFFGGAMIISPKILEWHEWTAAMVSLRGGAKASKIYMECSNFNPIVENAVVRRCLYLKEKS